MFDELLVSIQGMLDKLIGALPSVIQALLLLLLAWIVASIVKTIIQKLLVKVGLGKALSKTPLVSSEDEGNKALESVGKIAYFLVFILFLPAVFGALNMVEVAQPITNMMEQFLNFIPNIIAAGVIIFIGVFIAKLVKELFRNFFDALNLDKIFKRVNPDKGDYSESQSTISNVISTVIYVLILIPFITIGLEALNIATISNPIQAVIQDVLAIIPNIFVAVILVVIGYYIGKFLGNLLNDLLQGVGLNKIFNSLGLSDDVDSSKFNLAKILGTVVQVLIVLFFTVEALNVINLDILNTIGQAVIQYLPFLLSALIILGLGLFFANVLGNWIEKNSKAAFTPMIVKAVIITFTVFMALEQLHFATSIVNKAFIIILGGVMVAFAIAFGLGGRDFAKERLEKLGQKIDKSE